MLNAMQLLIQTKSVKSSVIQIDSIWKVKSYRHDKHLVQFLFARYQTQKSPKI